MRHIVSLHRCRALLRRPPANTGVDSFAGPSLVQQEPGLAQEAARFNVSASAWAAGSSPD